MFALAAAIVFLLGLLGVGFADMILLGLFLLALHFIVDVGLPWRR